MTLGRRVPAADQSPDAPALWEGEEPAARATGPRSFMHVPKCGGMSIHAALENAFGHELVAPQRQDTSVMAGVTLDQLDPDVRALIAAGPDEVDRLAEYAIVSGHFCLPNLLRLTPAASVATVLREPRSRLLSAFAFWWLCQLYTDTDKDPLIEGSLCSLDGFLASPVAAPAIDNPLCRMLLFGDPRIPADGFIDDPEAVAADAIAALRTLGFVGIVEMPGQMWQGLSAFFGVQLSREAVNVTAVQGARSYAPELSDKISAQTLGLINARTAADAIIYRQALCDAGLAESDAKQLQQAAFATELVRFGNATGSYAATARDHGRTIGQLQEQLQAVREDLAAVETQLAAQRGQLDALRRSASWRITAPVRTARRTCARWRRKHFPIA